MSFFTPFKLPEAPKFKSFTASIRDFGAEENSIEKNSEAIHRAIDACETNGGGSVIIPEGVWKCGPIHLKSNINLHLEKGSVLDFSKNFEDYLPTVLTYRGGMALYGPSPFIYARNAENIAITGDGVLQGNGYAFWGMAHSCPGMTDLRIACKERRPVEKRVYGKVEDGVRPAFVQFINCAEVLIDGVTLLNSPSWSVHPILCKNVTVRNIKISNPKGTPNTDGVDIESCRRVLVEDCKIDTADDIICIKSGRNQDGWDGAMPPCEDVLVRGCEGKNGSGGATVGSETSGGVNNVMFENCSFDGAKCGIRVKTCRIRGGYIRNVSFYNVNLSHSAIAGIDVDMQAYAGSFEDKLYPDNNENPEVRVPTVSNISARNVKSVGSPIGIRLLGLENHEIKGVELTNIEIVADEAIKAEHTLDIKINSLNIFGV